MDRLTTEEYKSLLKSYEACFAWLFPKIGFVTFDDSFVVKGTMYRNKKITGSSMTETHFVIELEDGETVLMLPIEQEAIFEVL